MPRHDMVRLGRSCDRRIYKNIYGKGNRHRQGHRRPPPAEAKNNEKECERKKKDRGTVGVQYSRGRHGVVRSATIGTAASHGGQNNSFGGAEAPACWTPGCILVRGREGKDPRGSKCEWLVKHCALLFVLFTGPST